MNIEELIKSLDNQIKDIEEEKKNNKEIKTNNKPINIQETSYGKYCIFLNTYEELINFIKENKNTTIITHDIQHPKNKQKYNLDYLAKDYNSPLIYTDNEHPINIIKTYDLGTQTILINPTFLKKYQKQFEIDIKNIILEIIKTKPQYLYIPDLLINNDFIQHITNSQDLKDTNIYFDKTTTKTLSKEQIKLFKENHLTVYFNDELISSNKVIYWYTINKLKEKETLNLWTDLTQKEINNFIYINESTKITISPIYSQVIDEIIYIEQLKKIFDIIKNHNRTYNIEIKIENRHLLTKLNLSNYPNINFTIKNNLYNYTQEEYIKEEKQLYQIIEPIKISNLTPYEKYLAIYNIVKQFKPYKENEQASEQSRSLRYILNNDYIVCVGFSDLLTTLLDKVGIPSITTDADVDISKYNDNLENIPTDLKGHQRNIVKIDDDKYNIHGIYIVDPTWDNNIQKDLYNNSTSTFDKRKESRRLEKLTDIDLLLDFHNFDEFLEKINYYLKKEINKKDSFQTKELSFIERIINTYNKLYYQILNILIKLDYSKYQELTNKYNDKLSNPNSLLIKLNKSIQEYENNFADFLTDYSKYIIPLSNQKVNTETTLIAASNIKKELEKYSNKELEEWVDKTLEDNIEQKNRSFPYHYNPNDKRQNYLESSNSHKIK